MGVGKYLSGSDCVVRGIRVTASKSLVAVSKKEPVVLPSSKFRQHC